MYPIVFFLKEHLLRLPDSVNSMTNLGHPEAIYIFGYDYDWVRFGYYVIQNYLDLLMRQINLYMQ
jgi:hypothetical protein